MIFSGGIEVSIFSIFILSICAVAKGNRCLGTVHTSSATGGLITSPNYPDEYGAVENCTWAINVRANQYVVIDMDELQLHFTDDRGKVQCGPSYSLKINGERLGCNPPRITDRSDRQNRFCMQFHNAICPYHPYCNVTRRIANRIEITYEGAGEAVPPPEWTPYTVGFRIRYSRFHCRPWDFATKLEQTRCVGTVLKFSTSGGVISSPSYPDEYGTVQNCSWTINVPANQYIVLDVYDLQLHFTDSRGVLLCRPSYKLKINGERLGCNPPLMTDRRFQQNRFCMQYHNAVCPYHPFCNVSKKIANRVEITYEAIGEVLPPRDWHPYMAGFRIHYQRFPCRPLSSAKTASESTTSKPECVTNAMPTALHDANWTANWTNAVIGGAVVLVLVLLFVAMRQRVVVTWRNPCHHTPPVEINSQEAEDPETERDTFV